MDDPAATQACDRCGIPLAPDALVCAGCQAIVHATSLEGFAARAREFEAGGNAAAALEEWRAALQLLPPDSSQANWIRGRLAALSPDPPPPTEAKSGWRRRLGPWLALAPLLAKGKLLFTLLKLKFLLSFAAFAGIYWALYGIKFGIGLALLILVHELGHLVEARRRGLTADLPMFIPGFGAYVRYKADGVTAHARALIALAGPLAGTLAAVVCAALWLQTNQKFWLALASFSAFVNLLNLIPIWTLDGGQAISVVNRAGRIGIAIAAVLFALFCEQPMLFFVAGGAIYRAVRNEAANDLPPDYGATAYFIVLLTILGYVSSFASVAASH